MQQLFDYAESNYDDECQRYSKECPYPTDQLSPELTFKQVYSWFMTEKVLPSIGKTVLEEFVAKRVQSKSPGLARKLLQMKDVIRGTFEVLDVDSELISVKHKESGTTYKVVPISEKFRQSFTKDDVITGSRIHPWGDRFRFAGIVTRQERDEEVGRRLGLIIPEMAREWIERGWNEDAESMLVSDNTRLSAAMNKYPWQWVDGICKAMQIETRGLKKREKVGRVVSKLVESGYARELLKDRRKIPERSLEALRRLVDNGFVAKYGTLSRRFTTEAGFWWNDQPPKSEIGLLRLHGLVVVGKMPMQGRLFRMILIPVELRHIVMEFFYPRSSPATVDEGGRFV
jgi:hypothetical protein